MDEQLQLRIYGNATLPTLIYLPGLHGDWTLIGGFRSAVAGKVRFVEMAYPRTLDWSVNDYAAAIEMALLQNGITRGWLLGESFGSQLMWAMAGRGHFQADGLILAGGFVRHPMRWTMRLAERVAGRLSLRMLVAIIFGYAKIARFRYRRSPETLRHLDEFIGRRTEPDRRAAQHRLHLVAQNDPRETARRVNIPTYVLAGFLDPIVPWPPVRRWLKKNCLAMKDFKIVARADHMVLGTGTQEAARQILEWMGGSVKSEA